MITNKHAQVLYQENMKWELNFAGGGWSMNLYFAIAYWRTDEAFPTFK